MPFPNIFQYFVDYHGSQDQSELLPNYIQKEQSSNSKFWEYPGLSNESNQVSETGSRNFRKPKSRWYRRQNDIGNKVLTRQQLQSKKFYQLFYLLLFILGGIVVGISIILSVKPELIILNSSTTSATKNTKSSRLRVTVRPSKRLKSSLGLRKEKRHKTNKVIDYSLRAASQKQKLQNQITNTDITGVTVLIESVTSRFTSFLEVDTNKPKTAANSNIPNPKGQAKPTEQVAADVAANTPNPTEEQVVATERAEVAQVEAAEVGQVEVGQVEVAQVPGTGQQVQQEQQQSQGEEQPQATSGEQQSQGEKQSQGEEQSQGKEQFQNVDGSEAKGEEKDQQEKEQEKEGHEKEGQGPGQAEGQQKQEQAEGQQEQGQEQQGEKQEQQGEKQEQQGEEEKEQQEQEQAEGQQEQESKGVDKATIIAHDEHAQGGNTKEEGEGTEGGNDGSILRGKDAITKEGGGKDTMKFTFEGLGSGKGGENTEDGEEEEEDDHLSDDDEISCDNMKSYSEFPNINSYLRYVYDVMGSKLYRYTPQNGDKDIEPGAEKDLKVPFFYVCIIFLLIPIVDFFYSQYLFGNINISNIFYNWYLFRNRH